MLSNDMKIAVRRRKKLLGKRGRILMLHFGVTYSYKFLDNEENISSILKILVH